MIFNRSSRTTFANWLDAFVSGKSTPANRRASDSGIAEMQSTAGQIHDLASQAARSTIDPTFPHSWEKFMYQRLSNETASPFPVALPTVQIPTSNLRRSDAWPRLNRVAGLLVAAALLIALSAGIWNASDREDNPTPNPTNQLSALVQGTPDVPGSPDAITQADLPTAEDCTFEPLTVDDVIWYVTNPFEASSSTDIDHPAPDPTIQGESPTQPGSNPATPIDDISEKSSSPAVVENPAGNPGYATADQISQVAAMQRMWMACVLADSYFQKWAVEDPNLVREQVLSVLPPLTGEAEARVILEKLQDSGATAVFKSDGVFFSHGLWTSGEKVYPTLLVDQDPTNTFASEFHITTGYDIFESDGTFDPANSIFDGEVMTNDPSGLPIKVYPGCWNFQFLWNEARGSWLISSVPICG